MLKNKHFIFGHLFILVICIFGEFIMMTTNQVKSEIRNIKLVKSSIFMVILLLSCAHFSIEAKDNFSKKIQASIDVNAVELLTDPKINSVSIGVFSDGKKYISHFGELDKGKGNTPTNNTIYEIASVSKTLTGVLVANAVLEGKLNLDDDIRIYLDQKFDSFEYNNKPVQIKHLLTHTSGLPKFLPESIPPLFSDFNESLPFKVHAIQVAYNKDDFFSDLKRIKLSSEPGTEYSYSNVDTELMAQILENVYHKPFDVLLQNYFRSIANMQNTFVKIPSNLQSELANGYGITGKKVPHEVVLYGADGGVKTTMTDLVNYLELQLSKENIVIEESHRNLSDVNSKKIAYYMPIKVSEEYGLYYSMHGGGFGTQNWFFIIPKYNLGISIITNQSDLETADKLLKTLRSIVESVILNKYPKKESSHTTFKGSNLGGFYHKGQTQ